MSEQESVLSETLSKTERALRARFVEQYLIDYDPLSAAIRIGYTNSFAEQYAKKFLSETYTLKLIADREVEMGLDTEESKHRRKIVTGLYREAHSRFNSGSARVAALTQLAKITGIEAPVKTVQEVHVTEGSPELEHLSLEDLELIKNKLYGPKIPVTH